VSRANRYKGNRDKCDSGGFLKLPLSVINGHAYLKASPHARMLLLDLAAQYRGENNGDLSAAWSQMQQRGWRSKETLFKAKTELMDLGLIVETRMGARPNRASLYALTWLALDHCDGKLEVLPKDFPRGAYKLQDPVPMPSPKITGLRTLGVPKKPP